MILDELLTTFGVLVGAPYILTSLALTSAATLHGVWPLALAMVLLVATWPTLLYYHYGSLPRCAQALGAVGQGDVASPPDRGDPAAHERPTGSGPCDLFYGCLGTRCTRWFTLPGRP